jgi:hypothetical protein
MKIMANLNLPPKFAIQINSKILAMSMSLLLGFNYTSTNNGVCFAIWQWHVHMNKIAL